MEYGRLGKSGLPVSAFSFGTWLVLGHKAHEDDTKSKMKKKLKLQII